jgi:hypothetical protein
MITKLTEKQEALFPLILAYGESSGHAHAFHGAGTSLYRTPDGRMFVLLVRPDILRHEEHGGIKFEEGAYEVVLQREYAPTEIRQVLD